ncbi:MAG: tetratricopeptide repeat protein [Candidatus Omnitrophota bacterium]
MRIFLVIFLCVFPLLFSLAEPLTKETAVDYREEGQRAQSIGDLKGALSYYQKAVQLDPKFAQAYNDIGVIYETLGENDKALEAYQKALKVDPEYLPAYTNVAFIYEKRGDIDNATRYWQKRYELGREGDYWREVSSQHLLKLGTFPEVRKRIIEKKAAILSNEIIRKNKEESLKSIKDAKLHFRIGNKAFREKDYKAAVKEFGTVFLINPSDDQLLNKTLSLYKQARRLFLRQQTFTSAKNALDYIDKEDYLSAQNKLGDALKAISLITQEK